MRIRVVAGIALPLILGGCGAIFNGTRETINASSAPDQATVTVDLTQQKFTTPAAISLERKQDYTLSFSKAGYTPATFHIQHSMNGGILVLDILSGLVGVVVDAATGAWYNLNPNIAQVTLTKADAAVVGPDTIKVAVTRHGKVFRFESNAPGVGVDVTRR